MKRLNRLRKELPTPKLSKTTNQTKVIQLPSGLSIYQVPPQLTDPRISDWLALHQVASPLLHNCRNQLFLFLSGSFGNPNNQNLLLREALELGYHTINLSYPNSWTVGGLCRNSSDANCHEKIRLSILDGIDRTDGIKIDQPEAIHNRLVKLLQYLQKQHPGEGWSSYLDENGGQPQWSNIVVAGHSQGGGHAAVIAQQYLVARCIMLGSPADFSTLLQAPAPWLSSTHATPVDRYYGFAHAQDQAIERILLAWKLLGLGELGQPINVDRMPSPYEESHQLLTSANPNRPGKYHGSVAVDLQTPKKIDGSPLFKPVWRYLFS
ncbi:MAG TPA: hypothetical protein V6D29_07765 [Leptolyngbyaceae cyanobacterium]